MMLDWNDYRKQLATEVKEIGQLSPDTIKGYMALSAAGQKTDLLGGKVRELIALAVAVSLRCDGCITVHTEAAINQGATREEIVEALGVARAVISRVLRGLAPVPDESIDRDGLKRAGFRRTAHCRSWRWSGSRVDRCVERDVKCI